MKREGERTGLTKVQKLIAAECDALKELLITKNRKYGNSALEPVRIFSKVGPREQIAVRIDDKLSRIASGQADEDEDVKKDLAGYLILDLVAQRLEKQPRHEIRRRKSRKRV